MVILGQAWGVPPIMRLFPEDFRLAGKLPALHSIGKSIWDPVHAQREHVGGCWEVVHIIRGSVKLRLNGKVFRGLAGDTLLIPAQTPHRDEFPPGTAFEVLHIMFTWLPARRLFPRNINRELVGLSLADKQAVRALVFDVYDVFRRQRLMWREMTGACLYRLLLYLCSASGELARPGPNGAAPAARERHGAMIQRAKDYIQANLGKHIMLADIAAHLGISACHLSHLFSEASGFTLTSYLVDARMRRVAEILADPARRISEAAYSVGFENPNYFSKAFRRHFGCAPGAYRSRHIRAR